LLKIKKKEGNIDVSLLHCGLSTQQEIAEEEDVIWEWNKLFTEVVSVLAQNKEQEVANNTELFPDTDASFARIKTDLGGGGGVAARGGAGDGMSALTSARRERGERVERKRNTELDF
jgi:hypothetical protein